MGKNIAQFERIRFYQKPMVNIDQNTKLPISLGNTLTPVPKIPWTRQFKDRIAFRVLTLVSFFAIMNFTENVFATAQLNSFCELSSEQNLKEENGFSPQVIGSLSKIFVSQWALQKLGPHFQYNTQIYIHPNKDSVDIHIQGAQDPSWGRDMMHLLASELSRLNIKKIRRLTFDENFFLSWKTTPQIIHKIKYYYDFSDISSAETIFPTAQNIQESLSVHFVPRTNEYQVTSEHVEKLGFELIKKVTITSPQTIQFLAAKDFIAPSSGQILSIKSLPLVDLLKRMNLTSNNYMADLFFWQLGGEKEFKKSLSNLNLLPFSKNIFLKNGSGYPIKDKDKKFYNQAPCVALVNSLQNMQILLNENKMNLSHVLAVASSDESTLDKYELPPQLLSGKTGTVSPAVTFAGSYLTTTGPVYFSLLFATDGSKDWDSARKEIKSDVLAQLTEAQKMDYTPNPDLLFFGSAFFQ